MSIFPVAPILRPAIGKKGGGYRRLSAFIQVLFYSTLSWFPLTALAGPAETGVSDPAPIECMLESARLDFGRLNLQRRSPVAGVGEAVVVCQNVLGSVRRIELSLAFPTMGPQSALLRGGQGTLAVDFYRDAQYGERWGDDRNGAPAVRISLELATGERRRLRLPVHALLHHRRDSDAAVYHTHVPLTLTALPK